MRHYSDWLGGFLDYASHGEAPRRFQFWAGVSAIAGAMRRRAWIDQVYYKWYPNLYICLVAQPGVAAKSTTAEVALSLLRRVPGIHFGPDVVTWPALVSAFAKCTEGHEINGEIHTMSAMTIVSSEFGNLLNPKDLEMVDLLISLWDGKDGNFVKETKHSGSDKVENPWINLIACTTPAWIASGFSEIMISGGFTSRTLFVYADKKEKLVAYPGLVVPANIRSQADRLVEDLCDIAENCKGEYRLSPEAVKYGKEWYELHNSGKTLPPGFDRERFSGYLARKQVQVHKVAMILAAARSNDPVILPEHLQIASTMVSDLEPDMQFVFAKVGRTATSLHAERLIAFIHEKGSISYAEALRFILVHFPSMRNFEDTLQACIQSGYIKLIRHGDLSLLEKGRPLEYSQNGKKG